MNTAGRLPFRHRRVGPGCRELASRSRRRVKVVIPPSFKRRLAKKTREMRAAVVECVERLADNPRHPSLQTDKVRGAEGVFEAYVDRSNRVTFNYDEDGRIVMRKHCTHDAVLRNP